MNIIDVVIFLMLLCGIIVGFKKGVIKSVVSCVGTIIVIVLSFYLKNPLSVFLYTFLPFFSFSISAINILLYEAIAFLIVFSCLSILLRVIIKISGIIETILKITVVLAIPSKILGAIFGFLEYYVFTFAILFILACLNISNELITESKVADTILSNTPIVSSIAEDSYKVIKDFVDIKNKNISSEQKNEEAVKALLKYNIVSEKNMEKLNKRKKFNIKNIENIIDDYTKGKDKND